MTPAAPASPASVVVVNSASDPSLIAQARALLLEYGEFLRAQPAFRQRTSAVTPTGKTSNKPLANAPAAC